MAINCQPNESTGFTPYYLFHGRHPAVLGSHDVPTNITFDSHWLNDLKIAKMRADAQRKAKSAEYVYPKFLSGQQIFIRPDNSKHAATMTGEVVTDEGGATLLVQLENRAKPIPVHKGMVYARKYSDAWKLLNNTNRDFHEMVPTKPRRECEEQYTPVATRTRSRTRRV